MRLTSLLGDGLTVLVGGLGRYMRGQAEVSRLP
jgi:hypothetical protein